MPLSAIGSTIGASSSVVQVDEPQPVHYQDDKEESAEETDEEYDGPAETEHKVNDEAAHVTHEPIAPTNRPEGHLRLEEVVYKDEDGNIIPEDELSSLLEEQGDNIEFRTVYETQTKTLRAGEEPPPGAKQVPIKPAASAKGDGPVYPEGQKPESKESGEKKAFRT